MEVDVVDAAAVGDASLGRSQPTNPTNAAIAQYLSNTAEACPSATVQANVRRPWAFL